MHHGGREGKLVIVTHTEQKEPILYATLLVDLQSHFLLRLLLFFFPPFLGVLLSVVA